MSEIIKTRALVLRKIDFGDTSRIAQFYTEKFGRISAIIKGARSSKSKSGALVDTMNLLEIVLYKKENRDIQIVTQIDLIKYYSGIREDHKKYFSASAVIELLSHMLSENDHNLKLFEGTVKIFDLIDGTTEDPKIYFIKFFLFFLKEIGYEFQTRQCNVCGNEINATGGVGFNYDSGLMCGKCSTERLINYNYTQELFNILFCLNSKQKMIACNEKDLDTIIIMLERFLSYHVHEFKGIKSFRLN